MAPLTDLLAPFSPGLREELDYRLELMWDAALDDGEPFTRDAAAVYQALSDMEHSDAGWRPWTREIQTWLIAQGVYRVITDAEIAQTTISSASGRRHKPWDFVLGGQKYTFHKHLEAA